MLKHNASSIEPHSNRLRSIKKFYSHTSKQAVIWIALSINSITYAPTPTVNYFYTWGMEKGTGYFFLPFASRLAHLALLCLGFHADRQIG
jgi:hypothetical protein